MLYLIQIQDEKTILLKIGLTDNWERRKSQYLLHNPLTKFLGERDGDEILEKLFHLRFRKYQYSDYGNEWFIYNGDIIEGFKGLQESELLDWLWNNRLDLLDKSYFEESNSIQYRVVEKLYTGRELDWRNKFDNIWDRKLRRYYQDDITVKRLLSVNYDVEEISEQKNELKEKYEEFSSQFSITTIYEHKMKLYCDFLDSYYDFFKTTDLPCVPREFQNYVNLLGTKQIKALGYRKIDLENKYNEIFSSDTIKSSMLSNFSCNNYYPAVDVKQRLKEIYNSLGIKKKPVATDLGEYFEIDYIPKRVGGKLVRCVYILKLKE